MQISLISASINLACINYLVNELLHLYSWFNLERNVILFSSLSWKVELISNISYGQISLKRRNADYSIPVGLHFLVLISKREAYIILKRVQRNDMQSDLSLCLDQSIFFLSKQSN